jgi:hypothetical protein
MWWTYNKIIQFFAHCLWSCMSVRQQAAPWDSIQFLSNMSAVTMLMICVLTECKVTISSTHNSYNWGRNIMVRFLVNVVTNWHNILPTSLSQLLCDGQCLTCSKLQYLWEYARELLRVTLTIPANFHPYAKTTNDMVFMFWRVAVLAAIKSMEWEI